MSAAETSASPPAAMTLRDHLLELRTRLVRSSLAVIVGFLVAWNFHIELYNWLSLPVRDALAQNNLFAVKALQITESIEVYMKLSLGGGLFLASPFVFYQIWAFVAPGLLAREKRLMVPVLAGSVASFVLGAAFCYLVVLPFMTDFLIKMTLEAPGLSLEPTLASTVSFSVVMLVAFGAVFELPLFMYVLSAMGLVTAQGFLRFYRYWVVIAFIIGAVLTPTPDPINQTLMSGPLVVLYGVGIAIAWLAERRPGEAVPRRAMVTVTAVLVGLAVAGVAMAGRRRDVSAFEDLPLKARVIMGVHLQRLPKLLQQAEADPAAVRLLSPLKALRDLGLDRPRDPQVVLVRAADGVAVVLAVDDADAHVRRIAKARKASLLDSVSGPSTWFALPADQRRWRMTAAGPHLLWVGDDAAISLLADARLGRTPRLTDDAGLAERLQDLRGSAPVWALAADSDGYDRWLPAAAQRHHVRAVSARLAGEPMALSLQFECRGTEGAAALRDRLDAWVADHRRRGDDPADARQRAAAQQVANLAVLVARTAEASARLLPLGSTDHQTLIAASTQAMQLARETAPGTVPPVAPTAAEANTLLAAIQPPALASVDVRSTWVEWRFQGEVAALLAVLALPSTAGLDAAAAKGDAEGAAVGASPAPAQLPSTLTAPPIGADTASPPPPTAVPTVAPVPPLPAPPVAPAAARPSPAAAGPGVPPTLSRRPR